MEKEGEPSRGLFAFQPKLYNRRFLNCIKRNGMVMIAGASQEGRIRVGLHTSGHADRRTIEKVIRTVNPRDIICIHKEADAEL